MHVFHVRDDEIVQFPVCPVQAERADDDAAGTATHRPALPAERTGASFGSRS
jgi:hypothetical protein